MLLRVTAAILLCTAPALAAGFTTVAVAKPSWCASKPFDTAPAVAALNTLRRQHGLRLVVVDDALAGAAQAHSDDLAAWGRLSHQGSDGSNFVVRTERTRFSGVPRAENVAWNLPSAEAVVLAWERSPGHRANMLLADVTHVGVGYACSPSNGRFWTMVLGRRDGGMQLAALD
jgi:uncharacterized protein YkwD